MSVVPQEETKPEGFTLPDSFTDESRVVDPEGYATFVANWTKLTARAVSEFKRATNAIKTLAQARAEARTFVIRASGFPDWAGDADAYKLGVSEAEKGIKASLSADDARRLDASVRQQVRRLYMLPTMVGYIVEHEPNYAEEKAAWAKTDEAGNYPERASVLSNPSQRLKIRVREHYAAAGLDMLPGTAFHDATVTGGQGGNTGDAGDVGKSALTSLRESLGGLAQIVPAMSLLAILETVSAISTTLLAGAAKDTERRPLVVKTLHRISTIALLTAKGLDGKGEDTDGKVLSAAYWDAEKDGKVAEEVA